MRSYADYSYFFLVLKTFMHLLQILVFKFWKTAAWAPSNQIIKASAAFES